MKYLQIILILLISKTSVGQSSYCVIKGSVKGFDNISSIKTISTIKTTDAMSFAETNLIPIADGLFEKKIVLESAQSLFIKCSGISHEIIVQPKDTIDLNFVKLFKPDTIRSESLTIVTNEGTHFKGSKRYLHAFIDSLQSRFGQLAEFSGDGANPDEQKRFIEILLNKRIEYLKYYTAKYHLPNEFVNIAELEINGSYLNSLISRLFKFSRDEFGPNYFSALSVEDFTWEKCSKSRQYMSAARNYCTYFLRTTIFGGASAEQNLDEQYQIISNNIKDKKLRDYLLTFLLNDYIDQSPSNFSLIYNAYIKICSNKSYIDAISSRYTKANMLVTNAIPDDVLEKTILISADNKNRLSLKEFIKTQSKNNIIVDFWATWCGPCLLQMPYILAFEKEYSQKHSFMFVSVEKDRGVFEKFVKDKKLGGEHYYMLDGFNSPLSKYLNMKSIPRYIVLDKKFHLVKAVAPFPANNAAFAKMLGELN